MATAQPMPPQPGAGVLDGFHPAVRRWFETRFPHGPTEAQREGWPSIVAEQDTLIAAPTGSGKTLAAFLVHIDRLYRRAETSPLPDRISVVYVSPLKALVADIQENLERPLREIAEIARELGLSAPELRVGMRSGDTPAARRAGLLKRPPHFLVTTPESLYLLLTADKSRQRLRDVECLILDEIHALAGNKRGVHLALSVERLDALCDSRPVRVGLSATQRPLSRIAGLLTGFSQGAARPCQIVDRGHRRDMDLALELPNRELEAVASNEQLSETLDRIAVHLQTHKTTLIFTNTRRLAERLAHLLGERLGEGQVAAHHGSLSKEHRLRVEQKLRAGELKALVATASLELGIDVGPIELVCQVGSPRSIATFLQRVGRSGHTRFATPKGVLYPLTRDELVECAALLSAVKRGELDQIVFPKAPLDILAQQIVAECAAQTWSEDELFDLVKRAAPYAELTRQSFDTVLELTSRGIETGRGKRAAFLHKDGVQHRVRGRKGARLAALTSGGAIPETADYRVVLDPGDTFIGTINEDFAIESMAGDVFLLGSTSWRIRRVERGVVRVVDAQGAAPTIPFWLGEAPARTQELSHAVSELRREVAALLATGSLAAACRHVAEQCGLSDLAARALVDYLAAARDALGTLPTEQNLVVERFFDDTGGMQVIVHSPLGGRINRALGLLLRKRFCRSFDFELQAAANDDAIVLSLGPQHSFPLEDLRDFMAPHGIRDALVHAVLLTPIFQVRWRWNLGRALIVLRRKGGKQNPPQIQRMEADDVMAAVFPSLAACQDNATGPREIPEHPIVQQTLDDCLSEALDAEGLERLVERIAAREIGVQFRDTTEPSPLSHEILNGRPYTFLDDAPLEERRTRAVQLRRGLPLAARDLAALDPDAIQRVREEAQPSPSNAEELHDLLCESVVQQPVLGWRTAFDELVAAGRALVLEVPGAMLWVATERAAEAHALYTSHEPFSEALATVVRSIVRAELDAAGPIGLDALLERTRLPRQSLGFALAELEQTGFALQGHFDLALPAPQFCSRRLLSRIHGYTQQRLRREIEPVSARDYLRFLLAFHGVTEATRRRGSAALLRVIEQLQGFEAAASEWEPGLLAARIQGYSAELLDPLCWSGEVVWGRLTVRDGATADTDVNFSRNTKVTLTTRADFAWLASAVRGEKSAERSNKPNVRRVFSLLEEHGALFFNELVQASQSSEAEVEEALWDNVARGLVSADGFAALRSLLSVRAAPSAQSARRRGLRQGAHRLQPRAGRWAKLFTERPEGSPDEMAEAVAEQLLARYGVVFRDLLERESFSVPWREIAWALRRLEDRGQVRGGRFVTGFTGEQFALPEAVQSLRETRRAPLDGRFVTLSACDPLNLVGIVVPGSKITAQRGNVVVYRDGEYVPETERALSGAAEPAA